MATVLGDAKIRVTLDTESVEAELRRIEERTEGITELKRRDHDEQEKEERERERKVKAQVSAGVGRFGQPAVIEKALGAIRDPADISAAMLLGVTPAGRGLRALEVATGVKASVRGVSELADLMEIGAVALPPGMEPIQKGLIEANDKIKSLEVALDTLKSAGQQFMNMNVATAKLGGGVIGPEYGKAIWDVMRTQRDFQQNMERDSSRYTLETFIKGVRNSLFR